MFTFKKKLTLLLGALMIFAFSTPLAAETLYTSHTVVSGESVYKIAQNYGIATDAIVNANGLSQGGACIYSGMALVIDENAKNTYGGNYTVASGDSLYKIAAKYGISVSTLKSCNGLSADRIYIGQKLLVEGSENSGALSENDIYMMAKMIYAEARGESYQGQVAVGAVIMNRIKSSAFPNTMRGVLFQNKQFSAVDDGQYSMTPNATALQAAREAAGGADPTYGSLFYWNPQKAPNNSFLNAKPIVVTIGNHVYAK